MLQQHQCNNDRRECNSNIQVLMTDVQTTCAAQKQCHGQL
jgi:hypothetical protein